MREARKKQLSLTESWLDLEHAHELEAISRLLDAHPTISELVAQDLRSAGLREDVSGGARGMSAEQVLRALIIKQMNGFSYRQLAFHLTDSRTYRTFCRLGILDRVPGKSALGAACKALRAETLEQIHRILLEAARKAGIETGRKVRVDCTVVESNIHAPTDSGLLWDTVRKLTDLMKRAQELLGEDRIEFHNRTRRAKRRHREISTAKTAKKRTKHYRDLIQVTEEVKRMAAHVRWVLEQRPAEERAGLDSLVLDDLGRQLGRYLALSDQVLDQTQRRVLDGESVPAQEKVVSIFEDHTDIICKDRRDTYYGHKVCLSAGASSMILDCVVLDGNPADSTLAETMIDRQVEIYQRPPRQVTYDGAFASRPNLEALQGMGVRDTVFAKGRGLEVSEMAKSTWVYRNLRNFRAGVEGIISFLKRAFGLDRCTWRSLPSFHSYVWSSILASNLLVMARHLIAT